MSVKTHLKAAKAAIDTQDWKQAETEAQAVLSTDSQNFFARLFLGRALEKQDKFDEAAKTYNAAAQSRPEDSQAWLGLCSLYESQGAQKIDEYREAALKAAEIFAAADDALKCQTVIDKFVDFARKHGSSAQVKRAYQVLLPSSPVYDCLEGRILHPSLTYTRLAELTETIEDQQIKREIENRRTRIGARLAQVTIEVKREIFSNSDLEQLYQEVINWSNDDEVRRQYEEKLLDRANDHLIVLPLEQKAIKLDQVLTLAEGMVIIKHPFQLAWDLVLETRDLDELRDLDVNTLREYIELFPTSGLGRVIEGWLTSEISPFPAPPVPKDPPEDYELPKEYSPEDRLLLMTEGLTNASSSPMAYRLVGDYYLHLEEHETAIDTARTGLRTLRIESAKLGMGLQNTGDALNTVLASGLVHHQSPRNHPEARQLFEDILQRKSKLTPALIGLGLIYEETENYHDAISFFERALEQDPGNITVGTEMAWCKALSSDYSTAQAELEAYLPRIKTDDPRSRDLRAKVLYRIGICIWNIDSSKAARKNRDGAYAQFLSSIKTNVNFAPAYTSLGLYYMDYGKDRKRARQCFQKAFELSPSETFAAERLAQYFADQGDWDIVEVVAQRVVDSGRARPPPGSKRRGISWPYSALGIVQMNKQQYQQAIVSFLAALRISPDDYQSYVGLGESYHNSGRYNSALRTFTYALEPPEGVKLNVIGETWFARYMLANVHRELGDFDEAASGLRLVLESRPDEFGVLMSLLQTFVEKAWSCFNTGLYGQAVECATEAIATARLIVVDRPATFNLWKGIGDACMVFSCIQSGYSSFPLDDVRFLLHTTKGAQTYTHFEEIDRIELDRLAKEGASDGLSPALVAGVLAMKRAISTAAEDIHAQAVAWYNLGLAEYRCFIGGNLATGSRRFLKVAVRCFKKAIELESGNAEFWNAMGVVTTTLNPKVAQHSLIRSLNINELNAKVWANLGVLYLLQNDFDLAHQAFGRAQSTDPEYAHAWVGEGLLSLLAGETKLALNHFTHAFEIADSSSVITKRQYAMSSFDYLLVATASSNDLAKLIQPIFALEQLRAQVPHDLTYRHLSALFLERVGDHNAAIEILTDLCASAETEYESTESDAALARFSHAKCDLARNQLAAGVFESAIENAETALDLSSDADASGLDSDARRKLRLSAHLTAGLAFHRLNRGGNSISMFRAALDESSSDPDVVCLLVQTLWSHGGADQKSVAREQLFSAVEKFPDHIRCVTLLGTIAALDDDEETVSAIKSDLLSLRTSSDLSRTENDSIETLLSHFAALNSEDSQLTEIQSAILLNPNQSLAWTELADHTGDEYTARMALITAKKSLPPVGDLEPEGLSQAFAGVGTAADAQRAIMLTPARKEAWTSLVEALST